MQNEALNIIMTREEKIKVLKDISEGKQKPLNLINHGFWIWLKQGDHYKCEVPGYEHLTLTEGDFLQVKQNGGLHTVYEKTYEDTYKQVTSDCAIAPSWVDKDSSWGWGLSFIPTPEQKESVSNSLKTNETLNNPEEIQENDKPVIQTTEENTEPEKPKIIVEPNSRSFNLRGKNISIEDLHWEDVHFNTWLDRM